MARPWALWRVAETPQIVPAPLRCGRATSGAFDPGSGSAACPAATFSGRSVQGLGQGPLLVRCEEGGTAWVVAAPVGEPRITEVIVAGNQGTDPFVTQADESSRGFGGVALANEPQGLVAPRRCSRRSLLVALPKFLNGEMRSKLYSSRHNGSIHPVFVLHHSAHAQHEQQEDDHHDGGNDGASVHTAAQHRVCQA